MGLSSLRWAVLLLPHADSVARKREDRDEAIRQCLKTQGAASVRLLSGLCGAALTVPQTRRVNELSNGTCPTATATSQETSFDRIGDLLGAISAGTLTATELCTAFIER